MRKTKPLGKCYIRVMKYTTWSFSWKRDSILVLISRLRCWSASSSFTLPVHPHPINQSIRIRASSSFTTLIPHIPSINQSELEPPAPSHYLAPSPHIHQSINQNYSRAFSSFIPPIPHIPSINQN